MPEMVIRLPNWLGDVIMALPAIRRVAAAGWRPVLAGRSWAPALLAGEPWEVVPLPGGHLAAGRRLRGRGPEALVLPDSAGTAIECRVAGLRATGHGGRGRGLLLHHAVSPAPGHRVRRWVALADAGLRHRGGHPPPGPPRLPALALPPGAAAEAERRLASLGLSPGGYRVVCPLSVGRVRGRPKRWPGYPQLLSRLDDLPALVVPGPGEEEAAARAAPGALAVAGADLPTLAGLLAGAREAIGNDTGPTHLAAALGVRTLAIFGPGNDPAETAPPGAEVCGGPGGWPGVEEVLDRIRRRPTPGAPARAG